ncbi:MAG TPA: hypothetical protein VEV45_20805 [Streptosporangiaceae bacterium]|nr:hypothetical protein [Streptosporangiaceae bacterium]
MTFPPSGRPARTAPVGSGQMGTIYTVHFDRPIKTAAPEAHWPRHYTGWTEGEVEDRLAGRRGRRNRLFALAEAQMIGWTVVHTEAGDRNRERQLKQHSTTRRCPLCREEIKEQSTMPEPRYEDVVETARRLATKAAGVVDFGRIGDITALADTVGRNVQGPATVDNDRDSRQQGAVMHTTHREAGRETQLGQVFIQCECGHRETSSIAETGIAEANMAFHVETARNADRPLNDIMDFDHPVTVHAGGAISSAKPGVYAPELIMETTSDGQILAQHETDFEDQARRQGWELLKGWTGQYGYAGLIMHPSEFVGGALEDHIRETPGTYVVIAVECLDDGDRENPTDPCGWAVARRIEEPSELQREFEAGDPEGKVRAVADQVIAEMASERRPIDQALFDRTAPAWNCVTGDGPHYTPGTGRCEWCGMTTSAIYEEHKARPEPRKHKTRGADMITKQDALTADTFHENHEPAGKIFEWRRNGRTQTWVTRPDEFRVPVKYGLRSYGDITEVTAHSYHRADQCPTRHVRVRIPEERGGGEWFGIVIAEHENPDGMGLNGITRVQITTKGKLRGPGTRVGMQVDVSSKLVEDL